VAVATDQKSWPEHPPTFISANPPCLDPLDWLSTLVAWRGGKLDESLTVHYAKGLVASTFRLYRALDVGKRSQLLPFGPCPLCTTLGATLLYETRQAREQRPHVVR
jgi:hypothetical protein